MKFTLGYILLLIFITGCSASKKIRTGAANINGSNGAIVLAEDTDRASLIKLLYTENEIPFNSFSAKVKVNYEEQGSKQPEVSAFIRMEKDKAIWISVAATFLNIEAYRILITRDSVILLNKLEKTISQYPISYIKDRLSIPVNFDDVQRLIAGKEIFTGDSILSVRHSGNFLQAVITQPQIYNTIYFTDPGLLLAKQVVNVSQLGDHFTANLLYEDYEKTDSGFFSTTREIIIPEKEQRLRLTFRQYEFNKELSLPFPRPEGYDLK